MWAVFEHRELIRLAQGIFVALTFLLVSILLFSCQHELGSITGRVLDESSDKPIVNATIIISGHTLQTNAEGIFQVKDLKPGDYTLHISAPDYESGAVPVVVKARETVALELRLSPLKVSATVGASGGIVVGSKGLKAEIPAQALTQETAIKISRIESPPPAPEGASFAGPAYEISLTQEVELLAVPAKLTLPLDEVVLAQRTQDTIMTVAYWHEQLGWVPIGGEINEQDKTITVEVSHLSWFTSLICRFKKATIVTAHFVVKTCAQPKTFEPSTLADRLEAAWSLFIDRLGYGVPVPVQQGDKIETWIVDFKKESKQGEANTNWWEEKLRFEYLNARLYIDADVDVDVGDVAAHELFHVIQINSYIHPRRSTDWIPMLWWMEGTAVWAEAQFSSLGKSAVYQRYYQSSRALNEPSLLASPLDDLSTRFHRYLVGIFAQYLVELYGAEIIKETWELISLKRAPLQALDEVLRRRGSALSDAYFDFAVQYAYERGPEWLQQSMNLEPRQPEPSTVRFNLSQEGEKEGEKLIKQNHLSGEAFFFLPAPRESGTLKLSFDWGSLPRVWKVKLFVHRFDGSVNSVDMTPAKTNYEIPNFGFAQDSEVISVAILAVNKSLDQENATLLIRYSYSSAAEVPFPRPAAYSISGRITIDGRGLAGVTVTLSGAVSATVMTDSDGNYSFGGLQATIDAYTITPSKEGYSFSPPGRSVKISTNNVTGQDFIAAVPLPLPKGIIWGNFSIAIAAIERVTLCPGCVLPVESTRLWIAFRSMKETYGSPYLLLFSIADDRGNIYSQEVKVAKGLGGFEGPLPINFTWVAPVDISMPKAAPIVRIRCCSSNEPYDLDFTSPQFPALWDPPPADVINFGDSLKLDEDLSVQLGRTINMSEEAYPSYGYSRRISVTATNADYNSRKFDIRVCAQYVYGVVKCSGWVLVDSSGYARPVKGLSTETFYLRLWSPTKENVLQDVRLFILDFYTANTYRRKYIPVAPGGLVIVDAASVIDHTMSKDIQKETNVPIERTYTFSTNDYKAVSWVQFGPLYKSHTVLWKWYRPDGKLYHNYEITTPDPQKGNWWDQYNVWSSISIKGNEPASMAGQWKVELYFDGNYLLTETFSINN